MFRIRTITNDLYLRDKAAIEQVKQILVSHFPAVDPKKFDLIPEQLKNPLKYKFSVRVFVLENFSGFVKGFATLYYAPDINFCFLDYIATSKDVITGGVGSALYERVREESKELGAVGLFFECLPDHPALCKDAGLINENKKRLKFYEKFGARPIINTLYELPVNESDTCAPLLVFDDLDRTEPLMGKILRKIVAAILERKYPDYCPAGYRKKVLNSIQDGPVDRRPFLYRKSEPANKNIADLPLRRRIFLVVNDKHSIHHVRERGYVESPVRIESIRKEINKTGLFEEIKPLIFTEDHIRKVHSSGLVNYLKKVCEDLKPGQSIYPYVFPIRNATKPPKDRSVAAGYYCIDTFTPINKNAYLAAKRAVDCVLTASQKLLEEHPLSYALVRPPGHHSEKKVFGGFCYFNNVAVAANFLSEFGKVAILDIDYHHGNGQQDIFYHRNDVLTISIHGHPSFAYPYFTGFEDEKGIGDGAGFNTNYPLPEICTTASYQDTLIKALKKIKTFSPRFLLVSLGFDIGKGDPTGTWSLTAPDFYKNGHLIGQMKIPTLVVQEGGYKNVSLGINARHFFKGLWDGRFSNNTTVNHKK
jgi:acetoin utilization deacetylase AcuC-like enzyme/GNAT superfamily N-acetyltransferase